MPQYRVADAELKETKALPNGAATVATDTFDLGHGDRGDVPGNFELKISAPALATADLGDGDTMTYSVQHGDKADGSDAADLLPSVIVQTGADASGAPAATQQVRLPVDTKRYVRVTATNSAAGDASDKSMTAQLLF